MDMPTTIPPKMADRSENSVKKGTTTTVATILGTTRKRIGSNPIVKSASTSSDIFMVPISAAYAEPDLPATMIAVIIGPSSLTMARPTKEAT